MRSGVWLVPLYLISFIYILEILIRKDHKNSFFSSYIFIMLSLLIINLFISYNFGGIYFYGFNRMFTFYSLIIQFLFLTVLIFLFIKDFKKFKRFFLKFSKLKFKISNFKRKLLAFGFFSIIITNYTYHNFLIFNNSNNYVSDHGLKDFYNEFKNETKNSSLVFGNNYVFLKPYLDESFYRDKVFLPFPLREKEFKTFLDNSPNDSIFYITNQSETTWTEPSNQHYIEEYFGRNIISSGSKNFSISNFDLNSPLVYYKFDELLNNSYVKDYSGFGNNGSTGNIEIKDGVYNNSIYFENVTSFVSIQNSKDFIFENKLSVSFLANLTNDPGFIVSKGYGQGDGSFQINIWGDFLHFIIKDVGSIMVNMSNYFNSWHQYLFNYDGSRMQIIIDGTIEDDQSATGYIKPTPYSIDLLRDSQRKCCSPKGYIDDFQISNKEINQKKLTDFLINNSNSVFLKYYQYNFNKTDFFDFYGKVGKSYNNNRKSVNSVEDIKCYAISNKTFYLEFEIIDTEQSNISILLGTKFFTRVLNFRTDKGKNQFKFRISAKGNIRNKLSDRYTFHHLYYFRFVIIEDNNVIFDDLITVQDDNFILITFIFILSLVSLLINILSMNRVKSLIEEAIIKFTKNDL